MRIDYLLTVAPPPIIDIFDRKKAVDLPEGLIGPTPPSSLFLILEEFNGCFFLLTV